MPCVDVVPRMHFGNLPLSSSLGHSASTHSLSAALLRETSDPYPTDPSPSSSQQSLLLPQKQSARTPLFQTHRSTHRSARVGVPGSELEESSLSAESLHSKPPRPLPPPINNFNLNFHGSASVEGSESLNTSQTSK